MHTEFPAIYHIPIISKKVNQTTSVSNKIILVLV